MIFVISLTKLGWIRSHLTILCHVLQLRSICGTCLLHAFHFLSTSILNYWYIRIYVEFSFNTIINQCTYMYIFTHIHINISLSFLFCLCCLQQKNIQISPDMLRLDPPWFQQHQRDEWYRGHEIGHQPKLHALLSREIPQNYHTFALFDTSKLAIFHDPCDIPIWKLSGIWAIYYKSST